MLTLSQLKSDLEIQTLLNLADHQLDVMGYTEHGARHRGIVCARTQKILHFPYKHLNLMCFFHYIPLKQICQFPVYFKIFPKML